MYIFLSRLIILLFIILTNNNLNIKTILVSFSISFLADLKQDNKKFTYIIYLLLIIINSEYLYFIPLFIIGSNLYNFIYIIFLFISIKISSLQLLITTLSIFLNIQYKRIVELNKKTIIIRDTLQEDTIQLQNKNLKLETENNQNMQYAILDERNRISRQLHDSVGHLISSSIIQLEAIKLINKDSDISDSLENLQELLKHGLKDIRNTIHMVYYESFDLENEIYKLAENYNIKIDLFLNFQTNNLKLRYDILTIIKEAINNSITHSDSNEITIHLISHTRFHKLYIKDNGTIPPEYTNSGIGLSSIKNLVSSYKGSMNYIYDKGFILHITFFEEDKNESNYN